MFKEWKRRKRKRKGLRRSQKILFKEKMGGKEEEKDEPEINKYC